MKKQDLQDHKWQDHQDNEGIHHYLAYPATCDPRYLVFILKMNSKIVPYGGGEHPFKSEKYSVQSVF